MTLPTGTILEARYRIDQMLARGGMGAIYRAFDTNLNIAVAIKENFFRSPQSIQQFEQEALILARLRHPALPRVIHHFNFEEQQYLVMDFIDGEDLWQTIKQKKKPLTEFLGLTYMVQVCDAVAYLHRAKPAIIHRDIKPQNIKITPDGRAVLVDFGIAKIVEDSARTQTGAQAVTPGFSPPEQYSGVGTTPASDVYSLGATLYAVLTATKPPDSISRMVNKANFKPPNVINAALSEEVTQAIIHAMQPGIEDRPASVKKWQRTLQKLLDEFEQTADEETLPPGVVAAPTGLNDDGEDETLLEETPIAVDEVKSTPFWLINENGQGFAIGDDPLLVGRHSQADIVVKDASVSRHHALIRREGEQCMVTDNGSANGTVLNGQRLGSDWYPLEPGDLLLVGNVRFTLSLQRPRPGAPPVMPPDPTENEIKTNFKSRQAGRPATAAPLPPPSRPVTPPAAARPQPRPAPMPAKKSRRRPIILGLLLLLLLALAGGGAALFLLNGSGNSNQAAAATVTAQAVEAEGTATAMLAELSAEQTATTQVRATITDTAGSPTAVAAGVTVTATTSTSAPSATPTTARSTATNTPQTIRLTTTAPTATPRPATATPTPTSSPSPTRAGRSAAAPAAANRGPTPIPVDSDVTIPSIGNTEVNDVDVNPQNFNEVYALVKGDGIYKSVAAGEGPWLRLELDGASMTALTVSPHDPRRLYAPTWNAVLRSDDGGNSWKAFGNGLSTANRVVDLVTIDPANPNMLYAAIGSTLVVSTDGGENWTSSGYGNGLGGGRFTSIVVDPFNQDTVYAAGEFGSIYKSVDSGRNFKQLPDGVGRGVYGLTPHPEERDVYFAGINSFDAGIIKTENGADFSSVSNGLVFGGADSAYGPLVFAPGNSSIIYAGSGYEDDNNARGIFKSVNGGGQWEAINNGLPLTASTGRPRYVKALVVHPTNPDIVLAATGGGLYKTTNGGQNWSIR